MTAPKKVWRTVESSFELYAHAEFDAAPANPPPPFARTYPFDGMMVREDVGGGRVMARFYYRYVGDEWVEVFPAGPGVQLEFFGGSTLRACCDQGGDV